MLRCHPASVILSDAKDPEGANRPSRQRHGVPSSLALQRSFVAALLRMTGGGNAPLSPSFCHPERREGSRGRKPPVSAAPRRPFESRPPEILRRCAPQDDRRGKCSAVTQLLSS